MTTPAPQRRPLPVFMYHDIADDPSRVEPSHRPYVITPAMFESQMQALVRLGLRGVSLSEALSGRGDAAVLTFDDGHASNATRALPILRAHGFTATFFVTAAWIDRPPYMSWDQIRTLSLAGMEIGTHSLTHRPPATLSLPELDHELRESRRLLEEGLGTPVLTGSAPTGFHHPGIGAVARAAGYRALCVSRIGLWRPAADPLAVPRVPVKLETSLDLFERLARGDTAPLRALRARQALRNALKRALGVGPYLKVRKVLLGLKGRAR